MLATAVFTEPNTGSTASLKTRAMRDGDDYGVTGAKTWITHPSRADLMTLLVRTNPDDKGTAACRCYWPKSRAARERPVPRQWHDGREIHVLGYRGMRKTRSRSRIRGPGRRAARRRRRARFQAADGDLRKRPHPTGARGRGRAMRTNSTSLRQGATAIRQDDRPFPPRRQQTGLDGDRDPSPGS